MVRVMLRVKTRKPVKALSGYEQCILAKTIVPPPRPLSCRRYKPSPNELKGRMAM